MIPRVIHQIWRNEEVPEAWEPFVRSWEVLNPGWEHRLWTDAEVEAYLRERYPDLLKTYEGLSYDIERADLARYLILHGCGGVYADLDLECLRPISVLLNGQSFIACREPAAHAEALARRELIGNAFLASEPGHGLLDAVVGEIARTAKAITFHIQVLDSTGPRLLTRVVEAYPGDDLRIEEARVAYPLANYSRGLSILLRGGERAERLRRRLAAGGSWAVHYWANSWVRNLAGGLRNPEPDRVPGFRFYRGWDSLGFDLENGGRDVEQLALRCGESEAAAGFNTDGFLKRRLRPKIGWTRMSGAGRNEGLYVPERAAGPLRELVSALALGVAALRSGASRTRRR